MDQVKTDRRKAFVTGASGGIGAAIALELARGGFDVAISATRIENLVDVAARLEATGATVVPVVLDLRSLASIEEATNRVVGAFSNLDLLVNNAAITLRKAAVEITPEEWEAVIQINVTGTFFICQKIGRHFIDSRRPGRIINLASTYGVVGVAQRSAYGISKAAVIQMTKMLAIEWAEHGICVNAVAPGTVETPSRLAVLADAEMRETLLNRIPLHRFGTSEEVASAVGFLASPGAAFITGQTLLMDGGLTAC